MLPQNRSKRSVTVELADSISSGVREKCVISRRLVAGAVIDKFGARAESSSDAFATAVIAKRNQYVAIAYKARGFC